MSNKDINNIIRYESTDRKIVLPYQVDFGVELLSNIYVSIGVMLFKDKVQQIGTLAFWGCSSLASIVIPDSVRRIENNAFGDCYSLTSIEIPNSVTSIGDYAFSDCSSLTSAVIGNGVTNIGDYAFKGCSSLTGIEIPNSVTSIGNFALGGCSSLTSIVVDSGNTEYDSRNGCNAIIETASNTLIAGCQNTIIPNSVTSIGGGAFNGNTSLTSIEIPNSVTWIGNRAFYYCENLTSVVIGNSVTHIGESAFYGCVQLSSVYIKPTTPPTLDAYAFDENASNRKIYVPRASLNAYKTASGWSEYADAIEPYDY